MLGHDKYTPGRDRLHQRPHQVLLWIEQHHCNELFPFGYQLLSGTVQYIPTSQLWQLPGGCGFTDIHLLDCQLDCHAVQECQRRYKHVSRNRNRNRNNYVFFTIRIFPLKPIFMHKIMGKIVKPLFYAQNNGVRKSVEYIKYFFCCCSCCCCCCCVISSSICIHLTHPYTTVFFQSVYQPGGLLCAAGVEVAVPNLFSD